MKNLLVAVILFTSCSMGFARNSECHLKLQNTKITFQVPYKAGGSFDLTARALSEPFKEITHAKILIQNNPILGGLYSINSVKNSNVNDIHLGFFSARNLIELAHANNITWSNDFTSLTTYISEETIWLTRKINGADLRNTSEIIIAGSKNDDLEAKAIAKLLGKKYRLISGYSGSSDYANATLRNEVDFFGPVKFTANRFISTGDYKPALIISNVSNSDYPQTPYLADPKGLITKSNLPVKVSLKIAKEVVNISRSDRIIFASRHLPQDILDCLATTTMKALESKSFSDKASKLKLSLLQEDSRKSNNRLLEIENSLKLVRNFVND